MGFVLLNFLFYMYVLSIIVCPFVLFLLAIVLSVLIRYTYSDYPFCIFKLFLLSGVLIPEDIFHQNRLFCTDMVG